MAVEINITHQHARGIDEAKRRITTALASIAKKYSIHGTWISPTTYDVAMPIKGTFTIEPTAVRVNLKLGMFTASSKDKIEAGIKAELTSALA